MSLSPPSRSRSPSYEPASDPEERGRQSARTKARKRSRAPSPPPANTRTVEKARAAADTIQVQCQPSPTDSTKDKKTSSSNSGSSANITRRTYEIVTRYNETTKKLESFYVWVEYRKKDTNQFIGYGGFAVDDQGQCPGAVAIVNLIDKAKLVDPALDKCTGPITVTSGDNDTYTLKSDNESIEIKPNTVIPKHEEKPGAEEETMASVIEAYIDALKAVRQTESPDNKHPHDILGTSDKPETRKLSTDEMIDANTLDKYLRRIESNKNTVRYLSACKPQELEAKTKAFVDSEQPLFIPIDNGNNGGIIFLCKDKDTQTLYLYDPKNTRAELGNDQHNKYKKWDLRTLVRKNSIFEKTNGGELEEALKKFCRTHGIKDLRIRHGSNTSKYSAEALGIDWFQHLSKLSSPFESDVVLPKQEPKEISIPCAGNSKDLSDREGADKQKGAINQAEDGQSAPARNMPHPQLPIEQIFAGENRPLSPEQKQAWWSRLQQLIQAENRDQDPANILQQIANDLPPDAIPDTRTSQLTNRIEQLLVPLHTAINLDAEALHISNDILLFHIRAIKRLAENNQELYKKLCQPAAENVDG